MEPYINIPILTKADLKQIKDVILGVIRPLEEKVNKLSEDISDLKLETEAIHKIIETQTEDHEQRIERLEEHVGITTQ